MSKIKVSVRSVELANEMIEFWKDKDVNLEIKVKENTTAANSDVSNTRFSNIILNLPDKIQCNCKNCK